MSKNLKERNSIDNKYKWNIEEMYSNEADWEADFKSAMDQAEEYSKFSGNLGKNGEALLEAFKERDSIWLKIDKAYVYARMKKDEDNTVSKYQAMCDKMHTIVSKAATEMSFFTPEILEIPEEKLLSFVKETKGLETYKFAIETMLKEKDHVLTKAEENLMAQFSELTPATNSIFSMINNADIKFGEVKDEDGDMVELTHGNYINFMESHDRKVRENAFKNMYSAYEKQKNTLATTYNYNTKTDVVMAKIRRFPSARAAALFPDNIELSVYDNLIDTVNKNLPVLHRYVEVRRKMLKLEDVRMYDMYTPLVKQPKGNVSYEEALKLMEEGLAPLGEDYLKAMKNGIKNGWIDVYENKGKTSGAYSFGSYSSMPYILMNYKEKLKDVFTLVHEMGHSMHSYYTRKTQPYIYGGHSIFTAEVASTTNECLLMDYLLKTTTDEEQKKYLLNLHIEEYRTTLFRQTMFAEFEKITHEAVEAGEALTAEWLAKEYGKLNKKYFGDNVVYDKEIEMEWSRIPHFYNAFYVYKYATGYSAAAAISGKILREGKPALDGYIKFLESGESNYPIDLLKLAGVDMSSPKPIEEAMSIFGGLVTQLEAFI